MEYPADKRRELRQAVFDLRERGLYVAAKAAEQLVGLPQTPQAPPEEAEATSSDRRSTLHRVPQGKQGGRQEVRGTDQREGYREKDGESGSRGGGRGGSRGAEEEQADDDDEGEEEEADVYLLAKSFFDMREYRRAAHALRDTQGKKALFLRCYSLYLAGEKRKEEEVVEAAGPLGRSDATNPELPALQEALAAAHGEAALDGFGLYLYGLVLKELQRHVAAREVLCISVSAYPWNWSAWLELQTLCTDFEALGAVLAALPAPQHWMAAFFEAAALLDLQRNAEGLAKYAALRALFPRSELVLAATATVHYNLRDFDEAQALFERLLAADPYRVDGLDTYSNILYVKECFAALSFLAHKAVLTDKYRPETCCVVGNYYSLRGQHEKAVLYFRRALRLNRRYLSAWTLMGHEYVEMKNTPAAIDAYRRAVDINARDYRAWYGLGQTYEILAMPFYALHYYRRAAQLRPGDARMWCAMGQCYESEQLGLPEAAIRCYTRAHASSDREGIALAKLAKLHASLHQKPQAAHYYKMNLERLDANRVEGQDCIEALQYLANFHKSWGRLELAEAYATRLLDYGGPAKEDAKALLREIRSVQQHVLSPGMDLDTYTP
eukprot:jgi/Mesen1/8773/ME000524S08071